MATRLYLNDLATSPGIIADARRRTLLTTIGTGTITLHTDTTAGGTQIQVGTGGSGTNTGALACTSERVAATFTLAGGVTVNIWAHELTGTVNAGLRAKLWKRTEGGSDIETLIAEGDFPSELGTSSAVKSWTITPAVSVVVGENERLVLRLYVIPVGGTMTAWADGATVKYNSTAAAQSECWIELVENVTFKPNLTKMFLRRTTANGIGNFFDMLTTRGSSAFTTGVVNTTASGTDIQWTRTAGGTVLEWISPRLKSGFVFDDPGGVQYASMLKSWLFESAAAANCAGRMRVYRWRDGVETYVAIVSNVVELGTSAALETYHIADPSQIIAATPFRADDRIIARLYITNIGTMGGARTCTVNYDHNVADVNGDSFCEILWTPEFKEESDPPEAHQSRLMMGGVGN